MTYDSPSKTILAVSVLVLALSILISKTAFAFPLSSIITTAHPSSIAHCSAPSFFFPSHARSVSSCSSQRKRVRRLPPSFSSSSSIQEIEAESEQLRREIEVLRKEALTRLEALNEKIRDDSTFSVMSSDRKNVSNADEPLMMPAPAPLVISSAGADPNKKKVKKDSLSLLDETKWKISLSIGREPGTWMPATWGKSGQRLNLSFQAEFTPSQLYDRDDFLRGGYAGSKILRIVDNQITLGPSLTEGQRIYQVKDGGWKVSRGDGPMGTDLLRFYVELDEEVTHRGDDGCDVYVPKGRVYCSCGYFPFIKPSLTSSIEGSISSTNGDGKTIASSSLSAKEAFANELRRYEEKILQLRQKKSNIKNPFSLEGIQLSREIFKLNREAELTNERLNLAKVREPDKSLLRFSKDESVGLTREGGVCCRVEKGVAVEYHILGRFSVASVEDE